MCELADRLNSRVSLREDIGEFIFILFFFFYREKMNSNCRQRLAALLEGKEGISQSICESKNYLNCHALNACHSEIEYEFLSPL